MIVAVAGPAGSGKSTLGLALARLLRLPYLDLDSVTNPLLEQLPEGALDGRHWNDPGLRDVIRPARYSALLGVLSDQVRAGTGAVVVAPFTLELQGDGEWEALVRASGGRPHVVWLRASDELLVERRGARAADRDAHVVDVAGGAEPSVPHLAVDASLTVPQQVSAVTRTFAAGRPVPEALPGGDR